MQELAFVLDHVRVEDWPWTILLGEAEIATVGEAGGGGGWPPPSPPPQPLTKTTETSIIKKLGSFFIVKSLRIQTSTMLATV